MSASCAKLLVVLLQIIIRLKISVPSIVEYTYSGISRHCLRFKNSVLGVRAVMKMSGGCCVCEVFLEMTLLYERASFSSREARSGVLLKRRER